MGQYQGLQDLGHGIEKIRQVYRFTGIGTLTQGILDK